MKNISMQLKLTLLCCFFLLMTIIVGGYEITQMNTIIKSLDDVANIQFPASRSMSIIDMYHDGLNGMVYKSLYDADNSDEKEKKESIEEFVKNSTIMRNNLQALGKIRLNPKTQAAIEEAKPAVEKYIESADKFIHLAVSGKKSEAVVMLPEFKKAFTFLEGKLGTLGDMIEKDAETSRALGELHATEGKRNCVIMIIASLVFGAMATMFIVGKLMNGISKTVEEISSCVHDLQNSSQKMNLVSTRLASSVETQVSSITESVTAMDQISAMIKNNDASASSASELSVATKTSTISGQKTVNKMINEMHDISASYDEIQKSINQNSDNIAQIIDVIAQVGKKTEVINDIVFQTKLLSFNASVEAARAGESGKGFAVVAEEVGNLAQMSGKASNDIAEMLASSQSQVKRLAEATNENIGRILELGRSKVKSGNIVANDCLVELNRIFENINALDQSIAQISEAIREQSTGVVEVNNALKHLDDTTTDSSDMSSRSKEAAENLRKQSHKLRGSIQDLRIVLGAKKQYKVTPLEEEGEFVDQA